MPHLLPAGNGIASRALLALGLATVLLLLDQSLRSPVPAPANARRAAGEAASTRGAWQLEQRGHLPMPAHTPAAHASFLLPLPSGEHALLAFWFAGSRESAADVQIAASALDREAGNWKAARFVVNADTLGRQLGFGVRRLGNPVAWRDPQGLIHLFVVATGLGGWAASRVVHLRQANTGTAFEMLSFAPVQVLPLSWLWNTSFLVRTAPLPLADGGMVLPVYFELGFKYPVMLRFSADGRLAGLTRVSRRTHLLQPSLLPLDSTHWLALMRDGSAAGHVAVARTDSAGADWLDLPDLSLTNPDASIASMALYPGHLLLVHNSSMPGRGALDLSSSSDGLHWHLEHRLERGATQDEYSYPSMAWVDGKLWISYTDGRRSIAWQRFKRTAD